MDLLKYIVDNLITKFKKRDENGNRTFEHRWNPTTFGGGVDITTIPGVPQLLDQHKAEFGVIRDPMCLIAEAMNEYGQYCTARLRLETRIESHIKAGLTTTVNASSPTTPLHAFEDDNTSISGSEASYDGGSHVHVPADCHRQATHSNSHQAQQHRPPLSSFIWGKPTRLPPPPSL